MIRVVLDTNVFISGFLTPKSPPADILTLIVQGRLRLVLSASIASEIKAVLDYPKIRKILQKRGLSKDEINIGLARLEKLAIFTLGKLKIAAVEKDPSDNIFLSAAIEGRADYIVSGDRHLIEIESFRGIPIVTPAEFLDVYGIVKKKK